jgi:hypothetical protein
MTRIGTEYGPGGQLARTVDDNEDGTVTVTVYDLAGVPADTELVMVEPPLPQPLDHAGALAALLACLAVIPVEDAANAVGVTPAALEAEVLAWEVAAAG